MTALRAGKLNGFRVAHLADEPMQPFVSANYRRIILAHPAGEAGVRESRLECYSLTGGQFG